MALIVGLTLSLSDQEKVSNVKCLVAVYNPETSKPIVTLPEINSKIVDLKICVKLPKDLPEDIFHLYVNKFWFEADKQHNNSIHMY